MTPQASSFFRLSRYCPAAIYIQGHIQRNNSMKKIETGYRIGGRTWISAAWNKGTLTRDMIREAIADYNPDKHPTDEELREQLRDSEAEFVREQSEEEDNTTPYDDLMDDWIEREMECIHDEQAAQCEIYEALVDLDENWKDNTEDEDHFERVCRAHEALDTYCRRLAQMEFVL